MFLPKTAKNIPLLKAIVEPSTNEFPIGFDKWFVMILQKLLTM